jgi:hypothetical protein
MWCLARWRLDLCPRCTDRTVWLAASFEGMPKLTSAADKIDQDFSDHDYLAVPLDQVKDNFRKFDLPGDNVKFIKGWFSRRFFAISAAQRRLTEVNP